MPTDLIQLFGQLREYARRGSGSVVVICGESGVGKTYTVESFLASIGDAETLFRAVCRPQTSKPLYPIYETAVERLGKRTWRSEHFIRIVREYAGLVPYVGSFLQPLLPESRGIRISPPADLFADRSQAPHLLEFLKRLRGKQPAIFWIDSVQWADSETLEFLKYLRDHAARENVLWILTVNPRSPWISAPATLESFLAYYRAAESEHIYVRELLPHSRDGFEHLLGRMLEAPLEIDSRSLDLLYDKTRGVPYVAKTIFDLLREQGKLVLHEGRYRLSGPLRDLSLPASLRGAIEERLRASYRAVPASRGILETAAVIGEQFEDVMLDAVLDLCDSYPLLATIEEQHHLVRSLIEYRRWEFEHVTIREFIYTSLGRASQRIHRRLAEYLVATGCEDPSQIAYHFRQAGDEKAWIFYTLQHARQCIHHGFFHEARRSFDELWSSSSLFVDPEYREDQFSIHYDRALAYFCCSEYATCLEFLSRMPDPPTEEFDILLQFLSAKCLNKSNWRADFVRAAELLEVAGRRVMECGLSELLSGTLLAELVVSYAHLNRFADARRAFISAERLLSTSGHVIERAQLMRKSSIFYEPELAIPILKQAATLARGQYVEHEAVRALNNLAAVHLLQNDFASAERVIREGLEICGRLGGFGREYLLNNQAIVRLREGSPEQAAATFKEAMESTSRAVIHLILRTNLSACQIAMGDVLDALGSLERLLDEAELVGERVYLDAIRLNLAVVYGEAGSYSLAFGEVAKCQPGPAEVDGGYTEQKNHVLVWLLDKISALRTVPVYNQVGAYPHLALIDMQFWGD